MVGGDLDRCRTDAESALALFREVGDGHGGLGATRILGTLAEIGGRYATARRLHTDSLRVAEDLGLWTFVSEQLSGLGRLSLLAADFDTAADLHERALRIARERAHGAGAAFAENRLALADRRNGRLDAAEERMQRLVEWNERSGYLPGVALGKAELGFVAELRGDADAARRLHAEGLAAARATRDPRAVALALEGSAGVAVLDGESEAAARLLGAAAAARESVGAPLPEAERGGVPRRIQCGRVRRGARRDGGQGRTRRGRRWPAFPRPGPAPLVCGPCTVHRHPRSPTHGARPRARPAALRSPKTPVRASSWSY